jgi:menaquinone-9 beta-reductase
VRWDVVIVGAGPAGSAAALSVLARRPELKVLLLDRSDFPRDKPCGDGIAPQVLDVLAAVGVAGLLDDWRPVRQLELRRGEAGVRRRMARPAWVVPRTVFDDRLLNAACTAGASFRRHRVREVRVVPGGVVLDGAVEARVVVGADGAHSIVRSAAGLPAGRRRALALRGYAPPRAGTAGRQVIVFSQERQPSYAWSFDRGDGLANVGYGELVVAGRPGLSRAQLLRRLEELLPGSTTGGTGWRGHHLPLSSWRWSQPDGRLLLAGDAASLVNPMTGEGIYYAVATGVLAGRCAVDAVEADGGMSAGTRHRAAFRSLLEGHLRHTAAASRLLAVPGVVPAGLRAAQGSQAVFDDLVDLGLAGGRLTPRTVVAMGRALVN